MCPYLDYNATTPLDPVVMESMRPWFSERFGNPSSRDHRFGWEAAEAIEDARGVVAQVVGTTANNVVFTSSAAEAINVVVAHYGSMRWPNPGKIIVGASEHAAVWAAARHFAEQFRLEIVTIPVDHLGRISLAELGRSLDICRGGLVALMAANSEIGTIHPVREIGQLVTASGGWFLCDTTQAIGKLPLDVISDGIDCATVSAHKINGPKGAGALVIGRSDPGRAGDLGELNMVRRTRPHAGTLNVPAIVGLGEACRLVEANLESEIRRIGDLRHRLENGIVSQITDTWVNGDPTNRLTNTTNIGFKGIEARTLIREMHDVAVSTRSACSSGDSGPSHVLKAIGLSDEDCYSCIRFSLGRFTTRDEIDYVIGKIVTSTHKLRRSKSV